MSKAQPVLDMVPEDFFAPIDLLHFLMAPYDPDRRNQARAVTAARLLGDFSKPKDLLRHLYVSKRYFHPAGGFATIAESPSNSQLNEEVERAFKGSAHAAGFMLVVIASLDRFHSPLTASQNRAASVLRAAARAGGPPAPPERELPGLWKAHGATAPLWAAVYHSGQTSAPRSDDQPMDWTPANLKLMLGWAAWYREFALNHTPPKSQGPMLMAERAILLPSGIAPVCPPLMPLSTPLLAAAQAYKAAIPEQ